MGTTRPFRRIATGLAMLIVVAALVWGGAAAWLSGGASLGEKVDEGGARVIATRATSRRDAAGGDSARVGAQPSLGVGVPSGPSLIGRLVQAGRPLEGASVDVVGYDVPSSEPVPCDRDGAFSVPLPSGRGFRGSLAIQGPNVPEGFTCGPLAVAAGATFDLGVVEVPEPAGVFGRVVTADGLPIRGARVFVDGARGRTWSGDDHAFTAETTSDGRFSLDGQRPGRTSLRIEHPDHPIVTLDTTLEAGVRRDVYDVSLPSPPDLRGVVVDEAGMPIEGARVEPGGDSYEMRVERLGVETDARGEFALRCRPAGMREVTVSAPGFVPVALSPIDDGPSPLRIALARGHRIEGTVLGAEGHEGVLALRTPPDVRSDSPPARILFDRRQVVAADGTFRIDGVPEGRWIVRGFFPGVATVVSTELDVPSTTRLELRARPFATHVVEVVDGQGRPVDGAIVRGSRHGDMGFEAMVLDLSYRWRTRSDAQGLARLSLPTGEVRRIGAGAADLLGAEVELAAEDPETSVKLVLDAAGRVRGRLASASLLGRVTLEVRATGDGAFAVAAADRRGAFDLGPLAPGRYRLEVAATTARSDVGTPLHDPLPCLGYGSVVGEALHVEVVAGEETAVQALPMPAVSVCRGRVMSRRAPVAGAAVMVRRGSVREERYPLPVDPDSSTHLVLVRTDAEGRFEVGSVDGDGPVELRARAGTGVVWSDPVEGRLALGDGATEVVLGIPGGAVRGRFDVAPWPGAERRDAHVELYPMEHADRAPRHSIWSSDGPRWLRHLARSVPLGPDGGFAFEGLPAGTWVLRLWRSPDRWPRVVSLGEDENLDVGTIVAPTAVPLGIETGLGPEHGVEIFRLVDTAEVYIRGIVPRDGALDWGALPPGRYRLRACPVKVVSFSGPYGGSTALRLDEPEGDPVDITVGADGRCTPARVW